MSNSKPKIKNSLPVVIILMAVIIGGFLIWDQSRVPIAPPADDDYSYPETIPTEVSDWEIHTNERLGFSIKLPKNAGIWNNDKGDISPLHIFDDGKNNFAYIRPVYGLNSNGKKFKYTYVSAIQFDVYSSSWKINVDTVRNVKEFEEYIDDRFGALCRIITKIDPFTLDTINVRFDDSNFGIEGDCPISWIYAIKYSPSKKMVAEWSMGHDYSFVNVSDDRKFIKVFDPEMVESFKFE